MNTILHPQPKRKVEGLQIISSPPMSKKEIRVPVSRFTYQIITSRYGHPLQINRHTHKELCIYLQLSPVDNSLKLQNELTRTLEITLPSTIGSNISRRNLHATGVLLHQLHIIRLYEFMHAQSLVEDSKASAYGAMKQFYNTHNLSEDDFSFDSAYRGWLRYKANLKKNTANFAKNELSKRGDFVTTQIAHLKELTSDKKVRSKAISDAVAKIQFQAPKLFRQDITADIITIYLYRRLAQMSYRDIAARTQRGYTTVRHHCLRFEEKLQTDSNLRRATKEILNYLSNCKISVLTGRRKSA